MLKESLVRSGMHTMQAEAIQGRVAAGLTATGANQGAALPLVHALSVFSTVAASTGALLPAKASVGDRFEVSNHGANALLVYPPVGGTIGTGAANASFSVAVNTTRAFRKVSATAWTAL